MAGLWIEYHAALWSFWKVDRLAEKLRIPYPHALGVLSCLWTWAANNKPDGNLKKFSDTEIAHACRWDGVVNGLIGDLKTCELIDQDGMLHDWKDHGTRVLRQSRDKQQAYRDRKKSLRHKRQRAAKIRWQKAHKT